MKRHLFWIVELFIWLLILSLVSGAIILLKYNYQKNYNVYQIFLPDVDGLINGSPVRILGIQVGYVNQINIVGEDVYVKFVVTDKKAKIPPGSRATVEFSGLGGSKSLEIYPPSKGQPSPEKFIIPESPKRIHDSLGLLSDMYDKAINITYTVSHFIEQAGKIQKESKLKNKSPQDVNSFLNRINEWLDKNREKSNKFANNLNKKKDEKNEQRQN